MTHHRGSSSSSTYLAAQRSAAQRIAAAVSPATAMVDVVALLLARFACTFPSAHQPHIVTALALASLPLVLRSED
jgi:hypothetical protein